ENQGQRTRHGREREGYQANALIMSPHAEDMDGTVVLSWWIGYAPGWRAVQDYNERTQQIGRRVVADSHIKSALCVALPELRVVAFQDKSGDENVPARTAITGLRSILA